MIERTTKKNRYSLKPYKIEYSFFLLLRNSQNNINLHKLFQKN